MSQPSSVTAGGIRFPLQPTVIGPELAVDDPAYEAFVTVVDAAVRFDADDLLDALRRGVRWGGNSIEVTPTVLDGEPALEFRWAFGDVATVLPTRVVHDVLDQLADLRRRLGVAPPWLFRPGVRWPSAHPSERASMAALDAAIAEFDAVAGPPGSLDGPGLHEPRRRLLAELHDAGLTTSVNAGPKLHRLRRWHLDHVAGWYDAALAAADYLASDGRRRYVTSATAEPVWGGPVCIDLFRGGLVCPPGVTPDDWASWGEWLVADQSRDGDEGEFWHHDQDGWVTVRWRRDHPSRPSLLAIELGRPAAP